MNPLRWLTIAGTALLLIVILLLDVSAADSPPDEGAAPCYPAEPHQRLRAATNLPPNFRARSLAYSPDGRYLACAYSAKDASAVVIWDVKSGTVRHRLEEKDGYFTKVVFLGGSAQLASVTNLSKLTVWDLSAGRPLYSRGVFDNRNGIAHYGPVLCAAPDGKTIASSVVDQPPAGSFGTTLFETATGQPRARLFDASKRDYGGTIAYSPSGREVVVCTNRWGFIDLAHPDTIRSSRKDRGVVYGTYSADGQFFAALVLAQDNLSNPTAKHLILICDAHTGWALKSIRAEPANSAAVYLDFSRDGRFLVSVNEFHTEAHLWAVSTGELVQTLRWRRAGSLAVAAAGASGGAGAERLCWRNNGCGGAAFAPDGKTLAVFGHDGSVLLWDYADLPGVKNCKAPPLQPEKRQAAADAPLPDKELNALWRDLAADDAATAFQAVCRLADHPTSALALLRQRLKPAVPLKEPTAEVLRQLLADLDADEFEARQKAKSELTKAAGDLLDELRQARKETESREVQRSLDDILKRYELPLTEGTLLRPIRAVEVLEQIGSKESMDLLRELSKGHAGSRQTKGQARPPAPRTPTGPARPSEVTPRDSRASLPHAL